VGDGDAPSSVAGLLKRSELQTFCEQKLLARAPLG
jgi:hypothetical protein